MPPESSLRGMTTSAARATDASRTRHTILKILMRLHSIGSSAILSRIESAAEPRSSQFSHCKPIPHRLDHPRVLFRLAGPGEVAGLFDEQLFLARDRIEHRELSRWRDGGVE